MLHLSPYALKHLTIEIAIRTPLCNIIYEHGPIRSFLVVLVCVRVMAVNATTTIIIATTIPIVVAGARTSFLLHLKMYIDIRYGAKALSGSQYCCLLWPKRI